ncbi:MAG: EAL domain-containing protein [Leptospirales bacterium]
MSNPNYGATGPVGQLIQKKNGSGVVTVGFEEVLSQIQQDAEGYFATWKGIRLFSMFQGIYGLSQKRAVGFEGLIRGRLPSGEIISPGEIIGRIQGKTELVLLDRLFRAIHLFNFQAFRDPNVWLFLNVRPEVAIHGRRFGSFFGTMLEYLNIPPHQIVVEILESGIPDNSQLLEAAQYYRSMGCLLAVDDFGAGHSNFDRIWLLKPEFVKLDRLMVEESVRREDIRRVLPEIVSLTRASGSLALMEGIETEEEALMVLGTDIDFVQGFYFGFPEINPSALTPDPLLEVLAKHKRTRRVKDESDGIGKLSKLFLEVVGSGVCHDVDTMTFTLFEEDSRVVRFFVLDELGCQVGSNRIRPGDERVADPRFGPLREIQRADWSRRSYFWEALREPGRVYLSAPYLSITGVHLCQTLSVAVPCGSSMRVCCLDLDIGG